MDVERVTEKNEKENNEKRKDGSLEMPEGERWKNKEKQRWKMREMGR